MDPMHPLLTMFQSSCCLKDLQKTCDVVSKCVKLFGFHLCCLAKQSTKGVQLLRPVQDWVSLQALQTFLLFPPLRNFENNHIINLLTPCKRFCPLPTVNTGQQKLRILLLCIYIYHIAKTSLRGSLHGQDDWTLWSHQTWNNIKHLDKHS
jgi:hypothetical protein